MDNINNPILSDALKCAQRGWFVFPLYGIEKGKCTCNSNTDCTPGKHPHIKKWQHEATRETKKIISWWSQWPNANLAILTGIKSGLVVIDIDKRHGGYETLERIISHNGQLPSTVEVLTGGGGQHIYFMHPGGYIKSRSFDEGIDIKADGGYVVAPPSNHISGRNYEWELSSHPDDVKLFDIPSWLLEQLYEKHPKEINKGESFNIPEGKRNDTLTSIAGTLRRKGFPEPVIRDAISSANINLCDPPLEQGEVDNISKSISMYEANTNLINVRDYHCTDSGNAELMASLYDDRLRYDHDRKKWLCWNGQTWQIDNNGETERIALLTTRDRYHLAGDLKGQKEKEIHSKWAIKSESDYAIKATINRAQSLEIFSKQTSDFDRNPWLLGCKNGVIDLETGNLKQGKQTDMISKSTGIVYNQKAKSSRWEKFLIEVFQSDNELIDFVHRFVGYTLIGSIEEQVFALCLGSGSNGKSVFLGALMGCLGTYAANTPFSTFESSKFDGNRIPNALAALAGKRFVSASEVKENSRWNEGLIKSVTGEDQLTVRFLHKEYFTYKPQFTLWLGVNHKPFVSDNSDAFWRRVLLIPFSKTFSDSERDNKLHLKLREEYPGILAWAVNGTQKWLEKGLNPPDLVKHATKEYRTEEDIIQIFLNEETLRDKEVKVSASDLYDNYKNWCEANGEYLISSTLFGRKISELGYQKKPYGESRRIHYFGIGLLCDT